MDPGEIATRVRTLRERNGTRDAAMRDVRSIREGRWEEVAPDLFPEDFPKPIAANFIDVTARDLASVIAPLPSFKCGECTDGHGGGTPACRQTDEDRA